MSSSMKVENQTGKTECKLTCDFELLRQSPVFGSADSEVLKLFAYLATRKKYQIGEQIITEEKDADKAYYLISGTAQVTTKHRGKEVIIQDLQPETFFGELALLAPLKWFFSVHPLEECEVLEISRESFKKILEKFPDKRDNLIAKIIQLRVQRLSEQTAFILDKMPDAYDVRGAASV